MVTKAMMTKSWLCLQCTCIQSTQAADGIR